MSTLINPNPDKSNYELLFHDSPETFLINNARMVQEQDMLRFICFDGDTFKENVWFIKNDIFRIKSK